MTKKHGKTKDYQKLQSEEKNLERKKKINFKIDKRKKYEEDIEDEWEEYQFSIHHSHVSVWIPKCCRYQINKTKRC